jgi:hypothetical protein
MQLLYRVYIELLYGFLVRLITLLLNVKFRIQSYYGKLIFTK